MKRLGIGLLGVLLCISIGSAKVGGGDIYFQLKGAGDVTFSHDRHAETGLRCTDCHDHLFVTKEKDRHIKMGEMQQGKSCGACHNGKKAFGVKDSCDTCHQKKGEK